MGVLYYLHSENKDADQLGGYRKADLRICFRICKKRVFSDEAHIILSEQCTIKLLIRLHRGAEWSLSLLSAKGMGNF